jgi:hypothetical protein
MRHLALQVEELAALGHLHKDILRAEPAELVRDRFICHAAILTQLLPGESGSGSVSSRLRPSRTLGVSTSQATVMLPGLLREESGTYFGTRNLRSSGSAGPVLPLLAEGIALGLRAAELVALGN